MMNQLTAFLEEQHIAYRLHEPMRAHTTFKIGGEADVCLTVCSVDELIGVLARCRALGIPAMVIGRGSNLLVSDEGIEGAVIELGGAFRKLWVDGDTVTCGAGVSLSKLCTVACEHGLCGLEFAYGIPGSVGGAVYMNAGAYGGEIRDVCADVTALSESGAICVVDRADCAFGYRTSVFKTSGDIILFSKFKLHSDDSAAIRSRMDNYMDRRRSKQPLEYPSAGSVFKRPVGAFAGTLIESCGLKGTSVGGAQVSIKHAGFIINTGGATCDDVMRLVALIQERVKRETGYDLQREIIRIGR